MKPHLLPTRPTATTAAMLCAGLLGVTFTAWGQTPPGTGATADSHAKGKACQPVDIEAKKYKEEKDLLGSRHADEHAQMRRVQCDVEKGLRNVPAKGL